MAPTLGLPVTICVLFYGDHFELCQRFFCGLLSNTPDAAYQVRAGLNAVCPETRRYVQNLAREKPNIHWIDSEANIYKLPMMRRLFYSRPIESSWTLWFDDDSYVNRADWLLGLGLAIEADPEAAMWGARRYMQPDQPLCEFIQAAPWHRGKSLQTHPTTGARFIEFIVGGFWAIRSDVLRRLDWPDSRLIHFEDDYLLGEALRQNELRVGHFASGVVIDAASRRAPADAPMSR